eukprot:m.604503 g.604503  ORF g.604503 m.604503 type:complete len:203 (+) comp22459_c0_seq16:140-748(+)
MVASKQRWIKAAAAAVVFVIVGELVGIFPQPKSLETFESSYMESGKHSPAVSSVRERDEDPGLIGDGGNLEIAEGNKNPEHPEVPHDEEGQHLEVEEHAPESPKKKIAVVVTVTQEAKDQATRHQMIDGAAVLAESLLRTDSKYHFEFIAIVHPEIQASRKPLQEIGYLIVEKVWHMGTTLGSTLRTIASCVQHTQSWAGAL